MNHWKCTVELFCSFFHGIRNVSETGLDSSIWRGNVEILTDSGHHIFVCSGCHIKIPQTGWLKWQTLISHYSESWKSIINVPANSLSVRTFFLACLWPPSYCILTAPFLCGMGREKDWEKEREMVCFPLLIKTPVLSHEGPTPVTSFNINYLFKYSYTGQVKVSEDEFWRDAILSISCNFSYQCDTATGNNKLYVTLTEGVYVLSHFSSVQLGVTLWTTACQAPLSMEFSKQDYWKGLPFPSPNPGDLPNPGIEPTSLISPALAGGFFTTSATWEANRRWVLPNFHLVERENKHLLSIYCIWYCI